MLKKAFKSVSALTVALFHDLLSCGPSAASAVKTFELWSAGRNCRDSIKPKRTLMPLNQQVKEISKWNTLVICTAQVQDQ
jgi:hypothetical protein